MNNCPFFRSLVQLASELLANLEDMAYNTSYIWPCYRMQLIFFLVCLVSTVCVTLAAWYRSRMNGWKVVLVLIHCFCGRFPLVSDTCWNWVSSKFVEYFPGFEWLEILLDINRYLHDFSVLMLACRRYMYKYYVQLYIVLTYPFSTLHVVLWLQESG